MSLRREVASRASGSLATGIGNAGRGPGAAASIHTRSLGTRRISRPRCDREPQSTLPLAARVPVALRRKSVAGSRPRSLERTDPGREQDEAGAWQLSKSPPRKSGEGGRRRLGLPRPRGRHHPDPRSPHGWPVWRRPNGSVDGRHNASVLQCSVVVRQQLPPKLLLRARRGGSKTSGACKKK